MRLIIHRIKTHAATVANTAKETFQRDKVEEFIREHHRPLTIVAVFLAAVFFLANYDATKANITIRNFSAGQCTPAFENSDHLAKFIPGGLDDVTCNNFTIQEPTGTEPIKATLKLTLSRVDPGALQAESAAEVPAELPPEQEGEPSSREVPETSQPEREQNIESPSEPVGDSEPAIVPEEVISFFKKYFYPEIVQAEEVEVAPEVSESAQPISEVIPETIPEVVSEKVTDQEPRDEDRLPVIDLTAETPAEDHQEDRVLESVEIPEQVQVSEQEVFHGEAMELFEVEYSIDNETWRTAGTVDAINVADAQFDITETLGEALRSMEDISVRMHPVNDPFNTSLIYLESVSLEVQYQDIPELLLPPTITLTDDSLVLSGADDFNSSDAPTFTVTDPGLTVKEVVDLVKEEKAQVIQDPAKVLEEKEESILEQILEPLISAVTPTIAYAEEDSSETITEAVVLDSDGNATGITVTITTILVNGEEKQQIVINKPSHEFRPGRYTLQITLQTPQVIIISSQDFNWGVLALNMDKSMYYASENAYLQMGVLDDEGHTICDADLVLTITSPGGVVTTQSTESETITKNPECGPDNIISTPDYWSHFTPTELGDYALRLTATTTNGTRSIVDRLRVVGPVAFEVKRSGPTRIYPVVAYPVTLRVTSPVDWQGIITETVPASFEITEPQHSLAYTNITTSGDSKTISWNVSLVAGEEETLGYYFDAPDISPEFYLLGPLTFLDQNQTDIFHESREWQIASDATCAATTSGSWNTGGNWTGCSGTGGRPGTGDNITINSGITITMDAASAVLGTITVNGTLNTSNGTSRALSGTSLSIGTTGTVTANASTITLSGTTGTLLSITGSGVFNAGTSTVTLTGNGSNTINTAGFTGSNALNNLTVNITGVTKSLGADITMNGTTTVTLGTLTTTASNFALTTGNIIIANSANAILTANASTISLTGTSGTLFTRNGTNAVFNTGTSTVDMTSGSSVSVNSAVAVTFYKLTSSGAGTKTMGGAVTVTDTLSVTAGTFDTGTDRALSAGFLSIGTNGTLNANGSTVTMTGTTGTLLSITGSGVFNAGTSTVTLTGNGSNTINTAGFTGSNALNNLTVNITGVTKSLGADITMNGTTTVTLGTLDTSGSNYAVSTARISIANNAASILTANASTISLTGTSGTLFTKGVNGVFNANTSTIDMTGNGDATFNSGTITFYNVDSSGTGTKTIATGVTVSGALNVSAGTFALSTFTITLSGTTGTPLVNTATLDAGTGTITFTGNNSSGNTTVPSTVSYYNLTLNNTSETFVLNGTTTVSNTATITLGTLDTTGSNHALNAAAISIANSASAILVANGSTITLNGTGTLFTRGASGVFTQGTSNVTVTSVSGTPRLLSAATTFHILTINSAATVVNAGAVITTDNVAGNGITITSGVLNDGGSQIVSGTSGTLTIGATGTLCLGGTALSTSASCDSAGTATSATAITMPSGFTTFNLNATSTVIYLSNAAQTVSTTPTYGNLYLRPFMTNNRVYTLTGALSVSGNFSAKPIAATNLGLTVTMTGTWNVTGSFTVEGAGAGPARTVFSTGTNQALNTGTLTIGDGSSATTFAANASTITVTGSWTNSGTFTTGTSTVVFNGGTTATIDGTTTFNNLTITHSGAKEINFATTGTPIFHVTGLFSVTGHAGALIKLYSDASPTQWQFHPTGTAAVDYADVKDGGCQSGAITITPTNTTDSGNNDSCWNIPSGAQTLTFALSTNSVGFGTLNAAAARYCTADGTGSVSEVEAFTMGVATNAASGYSLSVMGAVPSFGLKTITAIGGTNTASSVGTEQFGLRFTASGGSGSVSSPYAASGFAYAAGARSPDEIASATSGDGDTTTYSARCIANISSATEAGTYSTGLTFVATGNF